MARQINRKKILLSTTSLLLSLGLIFSVIQERRRVDDRNSTITTVTEKGEVLGGNQTMSCPTGCTDRGGTCGCVDSAGGCRFKHTTGYCYTSEFECQIGGTNMCCVACDVPDPPSNNSPTAPTSPLTNGLTNPTDVAIATPYFSAIFNDPDSSDTGVHYQIQVNTNSSFTGTTMWDSTKTAMTSTANGSRSPNINYNGTALTQNGTTYYWRIKFWDNNGAASPWSATAQFTMNTIPTAPTSPQTNGETNPTGVTTSTPYFSAIFNDPDSGDTGVHYQIQVNTNSSFTGTTMWDSGKTVMTSTTNGSRSPNITYAGTNLPLDGTMYYWRIKFWDNNGADSPWSATAQFTMRYTIPAPSGLLTNGQTNPTGVTTPYPYFSAIYNNYSGRGNATHAHLQVYLGSVLPENQVWNFNDAIPNVAPGNRSSNITYGGDPLPQNGATYIWRIRFWDGVAYYSEWQHGQFTMNSGSSPTAPTGLLTNGQTNPVGVTTPQPYFSAIFNDPNSGDTAVYYQIFVVYYDGFTYQTQWDSGKTAMTPTPVGSRSPNITYNGPTLQAGREYNWQIKFWDNSGLEGVFSNISSNRFTMNTPPTAPTAPLTNGMTNPTDVASTPYFSAIFNDADSTDTGVYYQIQVNTNSSFSGTTMWDSGKTAMTATNPSSRSPNINYAGNTLSYNGTTYYWRIRFWDNHGVVSPYSSTAQFTTVISGAAPTSLLTNGQTNPTNVVPSPAPYFSAIFNHSNPSRRAVHYQIIMTVSGMQVWNSGKTSMTSTAPGSRCPNITYNGSHTLDHNGNVYKWTIVFWDDLGVQTATSAEAQFTMNRRPTFTAISNTASTVEDAQTPGNSYTVTWTSTASDPTDGHQVKLLICKTQQMSNGVCTGGNWCESTLANSDPTCTYTLPAVPVADGEYEAYAYVVDAHNTPAAGEGTKQGSKSSYYVKNVAPVVSAVKLNAEASPITLVAGGTKSVSITADVTDDNGCSATELPVTKIKAYVYRSGLANGFSDCDALGDGNANYCYAEISCTRGTCSGTKVPITCSVSMQYYADPTDSNNAATSFASQHWVATVKATDNGFGTGGTNPLSHNATSTAVVEVASLAAFNITASIDYDEVAAGERSGNGKLDKTIVTTPTGNVPMNQLYSGSNMCTDYHYCSTDAGYTPINVNKQKYALAANTSYATGGTALSATPTLVNINVPKVTDGTNVTTRTSWWGIEIPTNTLPGVYNGLNTITSQVKTT